MHPKPSKPNAPIRTRLAEMLVPGLLVAIAVALVAAYQPAQAQDLGAQVTPTLAQLGPALVAMPMPAGMPPWTYSLGLLCALLAYAARVVAPKNHWLHDHVGAGVLAALGAVLAAGLSALGVSIQSPGFTWSAAGLVVVNALLGAVGSVLGAANPSILKTAASLLIVATLARPVHAQEPAAEAAATMPTSTATATPGGATHALVAATATATPTATTPVPPGAQNLTPAGCVPPPTDQQLHDRTYLAGIIIGGINLALTPLVELGLQKVAQ